MFKRFNPNPDRKQVGDCVIRAVSAALGQDWETTYAEIALEGYMLCDMPSANHVWGAYLRRKGFARYVIPNECPDCYTVEDFCRDNPKGTFVLSIDGHVVAVQDGCFYDTWDCSDRAVLYYWKRKDD